MPTIRSIFLVLLCNIFLGSLFCYAKASDVEAGAYVNSDREENMNDLEISDFEKRREYEKWEKRHQEKRHEVPLKESDHRVEELQRSSEKNKKQ